MLNRIHAARRPYRPFVRGDVFPLSLKARKFILIGNGELVQLELPSAGEIAVTREWEYVPFEESA